MDEDKKWVICPACGHRTSGNFCDNCGAALTEEDDEFLFEEDPSRKPIKIKEAEPVEKKSEIKPMPAMMMKKKYWRMTLTGLVVVVLLVMGIILVPMVFSSFTGNVDIVETMVEESDFVCLAKGKERVSTYDGQNESTYELEGMRYAIPFGWHPDDEGEFSCNANDRIAKISIHADDFKLSDEVKTDDMLKERIAALAKESSDKVLTKVQSHSFGSTRSPSLFACYTGKKEKKKVDVYLALITDPEQETAYSFRMIEPTSNGKTNFDDFIALIENAKTSSQSYVQGSDIFNLFGEWGDLLDWDPFEGWDDFDGWDIDIDWNSYGLPDDDKAEFDAQMLMIEYPYSRIRLIEKLTEKGYSREVAENVVDNELYVDWQQQAMTSARRNARSYGYSAIGLASQLTSEGFTEEEVNYAIEHSAIDWDFQAEKCARNYRDSVTSREELVDKLVEEGFTDEQAEYGVDRAWR